MPEANHEYWVGKIARNVERDKRNLAELVSQGWDVSVIWECELQAGIASLIARLEQKRRQSGGRG